MPTYARRMAFRPQRAAAGGVFTIAILAVGVYLATKPAPKEPEKAPAPPAPAAASPTPKVPALSNPDIRFGVSEIPTKAPGTFRLTTWNIENLFDDKDDPANNWGDELASTKPQAHRDAAGAAIKRLDPDVLALEEIESADALKWFLADQKLSEIYPHIVSLDAGDGRGIEQAVISKFPLSGARNWPDRTLSDKHPDLLSDGKPNPDFDKPIKMARSPLVVDVTVPGSFAGTGKPYVLTLMVIHSKSGRGYAFQREAEARRLVELVKELTKENPARNLAVLGDFNARKVDLSFQTYTSVDPSGGGLFDVFGDVNPGDPRVQSHVTNRIIDHILLNQAAKPEFIGSSRFVYAMPLPPSNPFDAPKPAGYASDHLPVSIDLKPVD
jgi:endonuclease/exonuclease/phosphatase family metal-dependent hydrolase